MKKYAFYNESIYNPDHPGEMVFDCKFRIDDESDLDDIREEEELGYILDVVIMDISEDEENLTLSQIRKLRAFNRELENKQTKYIIKLEYDGNDKPSYITELTPDFDFKGSSKIENAVLFDDYVAAWTIAKMKSQQTSWRCHVSVKEYKED